MLYLILMLASIALWAGFLGLTVYEARRGVRFFAVQRGKLDAQISRIEFIVTHVDLGSFARAQLRQILEQAGHDMAHFILQGVRAAERSLTQLVRRLRAHGATQAMPRSESARPFVKSLSDFKEHLEATRPQMPEIK